MKSFKKSGFTLLELLVVISIIAILAVSLTPAFSRAREAARRTTCGQSMGQIHKAITMYEVDYNCYPATGTGTLAYTDKPQDGLNLLYRQYIDDVRVFSCPSNRMSPTELDNVAVSSSTGFSGSLKSSYGYSPGHTSQNSRVVILADKQGSGVNSDNHGKNAGQNMLSSGGSVAFQPALAGSAPPSNDLGKDDQNAKISDPNIFTYGDLGTYPEWDSGCVAK